MSRPSYLNAEGPDDNLGTKLERLQMPIVQFRNDPKQINITKRMFAPKKAGVLGAWFKEARTVCPQIPNPKDSDWTIASEEASLTYVKFELRNSIGEKCHVVIDRTAPGGIG